MAKLSNPGASPRPPNHYNNSMDKYLALYDFGQSALFWTISLAVARLARRNAGNAFTDKRFIPFPAPAGLPPPSRRPQAPERRRRSATRTARRPPIGLREPPNGRAGGPAHRRAALPNRPGAGTIYASRDAPGFWDFGASPAREDDHDRRGVHPRRRQADRFRRQRRTGHGAGLRRASRTRNDTPADPARPGSQRHPDAPPQHNLDDPMVDSAWLDTLHGPPA